MSEDGRKSQLFETLIEVQPFEQHLRRQQRILIMFLVLILGFVITNPTTSAILFVISGVFFGLMLFSMLVRCVYKNWYYGLELHLRTLYALMATRCRSEPLDTTQTMLSKFCELEQQSHVFLVLCRTGFLPSRVREYFETLISKASMVVQEYNCQ